MPKGNRTNTRGARLEDTIEALLDEDYVKVSGERFFALAGLDQPIFARQCQIGADIYGKNRRVDFILFHPSKWNEYLVVQCKWQASSGSVEEKYPFEVLSIGKNTCPTIIVLDGGGYTAGAEKWLRDQAGKSNLVSVMSLGEITRFSSQGSL